MTIDEKTDTPTSQGQVLGSILMAVGTLAIVGTLGSSFSRPASTTAHGAVLYIGMLIVIVGLVMAAASWVVGKHAAHNHELAVKVDAVNEVVRQLTTAPTVNLLELSKMVSEQGEQLQEKVLMGHAMVARRFTDLLKESIQTEAHASSAAGVEQITKSIDELREVVGEVNRATPDAPNNVVPIPNPRIYELGIAEGERRAREGRNRPPR